MAWNQPGNNGQDRDQWGSSDNQGNNSGENKNKDSKENKPLDIDNIFYNLSRKIRRLSKNKRMSSSGSPTQKGSYSHISSRMLSIISAIAVIIWSISGFYTIEEVDRGVITRFGKFSHIVEPGLNWKLTFIDKVTKVNVESVRELAASGIMLTSDENLINVEMNVQYRVSNPRYYLFSVTSADNSLRQATYSTLREVIGQYTMDYILTEGHNIIRNNTQRHLEEIIYPYKMGITLLDVNFQTARPPKEVQAAFDDAIAACENEQQYIQEAEAYTKDVQPRANSQALRILEDARAYKTKIVLAANGEVTSLKSILIEYQAAPQITREHLYIETMEKVLSHTHKIMLAANNIKDSNLIILPINSMIKDNKQNTRLDNNLLEPLMHLSSQSELKPKSEFKLEAKNKSHSSSSESKDDIMNQRRANAQRHNYHRWRE